MFNTKIKAVEPSFDIELAKLVKNPPEHSIAMDITPSMASDMLRYNSENRPLSTGTVSHYARQMSEGKWRYTRVPIIFSDKGRLIDGQHRLSACVVSETGFSTDVAFGAPDAAFAHIDTGKKRGGGDIFSINGVKDHNITAAISRVVYMYLASRPLNDGGGSRGNAVTPAELYDFFVDNVDIEDPKVKSVYRAFKKCKLANPSLMAGLYVICARKCRRDADRFFMIAAEGFGAEKKSDPALTLHKKFIEAATSGTAMGRRVATGLTINAWNRMREGLSGRGLNYDPEATVQRVR